MTNDHMVAGFLVGSVRLKRLGYRGALPCILQECVVAGLTRLDLILFDSVTGAPTVLVLAVPGDCLPGCQPRYPHATPGGLWSVAGGLQDRHGRIESGFT